MNDKEIFDIIHEFTGEDENGRPKGAVVMQHQVVYMTNDAEKPTDIQVDDELITFYANVGLTLNNNMAAICLKFCDKDDPDFIAFERMGNEYINRDLSSNPELLTISICDQETHSCFASMIVSMVNSQEDKASIQLIGSVKDLVIFRNEDAEEDAENEE